MTEEFASPRAIAVSRETWSKSQHIDKNQDHVVTESAVALVYNGISHVVMMMTPDNLEDFALGFSLSEGIIARRDQILDIEIKPQSNGIELRVEILNSQFQLLKQRRRNLEGRTGCGLCGAESLDQAIRPPNVVTKNSALTISPQSIDSAVALLREKQPLAKLTAASHAAAWCNALGEILEVREDVGRHNAVDKLLGALEKAQENKSGFVIVTSRASYEIVMKVASANIPVLVALAAPTSLAIEYARKSNILLYGFAESGKHSCYNKRVDQP